MFASASPAMHTVYDQIGKVAPSQATVLITGETGTGKELVAETIHDRSQRASFPYVALNCAAVSPSLIESELFGHEKGSFTGASRRHEGFFERARGGTLFLDEVTEMPLELQAKLLRTLETRQVQRIGGDQPIPVDVRLVAATNRDPKQAVTVDVELQEVRLGDRVIPARIPDGARNQLVSGAWNPTGVLLDAGDAIEATAGRLPYVKGF